MIANHELEWGHNYVKSVTLIKEPNGDSIGGDKYTCVVEVEVEEGEHQNPKDERHDETLKGQVIV